MSHPFAELIGRQCQDCTAEAFAIAAPRVGIGIPHDPSCPSLARNYRFKELDGDIELFFLDDGQGDTDATT